MGGTCGYNDMFSVKRTINRGACRCCVFMLFEALNHLRDDIVNITHAAEPELTTGHIAFVRANYANAIRFELL